MRVHEKYGILDPESEVAGFGQCLWNVEANKATRNVPRNGSKTLIESLENIKEKFGAKRGVGWREVVQVHQIDEGGAKREKIQLANEFKWRTYAEYYERVLALARGLAGLGLQPQDKVVIYAETQPDWMASAFAAWFSNAQVVTIYATLGEEGAIHGINETEAKFVFADAKLLKIVTNVLAKCQSVKNVITMTKCDAAQAEKVKAAGSTCNSVDELVESGKTATFHPKLPTPEDVAVIMYTSGTTGAPKGVVLSHGQVIAVTAGVEHFLAGAVDDDDVYLCYLPLAHIMEMAAEVCFMAQGVSLGFGSPHTLTDTGVKLKRPESIGDASCLQPTLMVFAPAVLDKVYQGVQAKRAALGGLGQQLFSWGLASGERRFDRGKVGANWFFDKLVFKKVQALVGGRIKCMITGSAPLSPEIQRFIQTVIGAPVRQGYGLTETCAGSCAGFWGDNATSSVGPPTVSAVVRLADWPEGNYRNSDKDIPEIGMRRGEILIGGPAVSNGYFINPNIPNPELETKNKEDWIEVGGQRFFRSGDIGQIKPNGTLQIIDRKKDLWKGPNGEYVALTKVEAALKLNEFVDMPMCYGKTGGEWPIALICPQKARLLALGAELGLGSDFEALCREPQVVAKVTEACKATCKAQKLVAFEIPVKYGLCHELWTPENDLLTAAMKLKRPIIAAKHKDDIAKCYA
jgi:long-subunit acyl-CoA synthetase (AMP-forming)